MLQPPLRPGLGRCGHTTVNSAVQNSRVGWYGIGAGRHGHVPVQDHECELVLSGMEPPHTHLTFQYGKVVSSHRLSSSIMLAPCMGRGVPEAGEGDGAKRYGRFENGREKGESEIAREEPRL